MVLSQKMNRRDFLKYSLASGLLLGLGFAGLKLNSQEKTGNSYGNGAYGGVKR